MANQEGAREEKHSRIGAAGVAGGLAMAFAQFLTQPGDVLKTIVGALLLPRCRPI